MNEVKTKINCVYKLEMCELKKRQRERQTDRERKRMSKYDVNNIRSAMWS